MSRTPKSLPFDHVEQVTEEHVRIFTDEFIRLQQEVLEAWVEPIEHSRIVMVVPDEDDEGPDAVAAYDKVEDEIRTLMLQELAPAIGAAFQRAATRALNLAPAADLLPLREFFASPKTEYAIDEVAAIFAGEMPINLDEGETVIDRQDIAGFVRNVSPARIARALAGLDGGPYATETRSVELPRWLWDALDRTREASGDTVGDVIFQEFEAALNGLGISARFDDAARVPDYATLPSVSSIEAVAK